MTNTLATVRALIADEPTSWSDGGPTEGYLYRLCSAAVRALPAAGATLSVMAATGTPGFAIASNESSKRLAELQVTLGEGPGIDAYALSRPVLESHLTSGAMSRWPSFSPAAVEAGAHAVFAFPLQVGGARLGVLDIHRTEPGSLTTMALGQALTFAEVAVLALLDGQGEADDGSPPVGVEHAMRDQSELYQAQGMVKIQLDVTLAEAMARIRAHAYANDQRLADVAHDVVARRLRLQRDQD